MNKRQVGPFHINPIGWGCMNICAVYGPPPSFEDAERLLLTALDEGVDFFDTAALYGFGESERIIGQVLSKHRSRFTLASKCGMQGVDVNGTAKRCVSLMVAQKPSRPPATTVCDASIRM